MSLAPWSIVTDLWLLLAAVWVLGALRTKPTVRRQPLWQGVFQRALTITVWVLLFVPAMGVGPLGWRFVKPAPGVAWAGVAVTAAGLAIAFWARATLAGNWSANVTLKLSHELVLRGPYAYVRHPIYSGISLAVAGTALAVGEVRGLMALGLVLLVWRIKWRVEERFMIDQFGDGYRDYRRRVKALIPGLW